MTRTVVVNLINKNKYIYRMTLDDISIVICQLVFVVQYIYWNMTQEKVFIEKYIFVISSDEKLRTPIRKLTITKRVTLLKKLSSPIEMSHTAGIVMTSRLR